jgi:hypothetical protein
MPKNQTNNRVHHTNDRDALEIDAFYSDCDAQGLTADQALGILFERFYADESRAS